MSKSEVSLLNVDPELNSEPDSTATANTIVSATATIVDTGNHGAGAFHSEPVGLPSDSDKPLTCPDTGLDAGGNGQHGVPPAHQKAELADVDCEPFPGDQPGIANNKDDASEGSPAPVEPEVEGKVHIPDFAQPEEQNPPAAKHPKLPDTIVVPIESIDCGPMLQSDDECVERLRSSIDAPWGFLLVPLLVSAASDPKDGKLWLLHDGKKRWQAAKEIGLTHVAVTVVGGTAEQIQLLAQEATMIRQHPNVYQRMKELASWHTLIQKMYAVYKPGGNKQKNAIEQAKKGLPSLKEMIEKTTGLKKTGFHNKVSIYENLEPSVVKPYLEDNPQCATAKNEQHMRRLSTYSQQTQKELVPYLPDVGNPEQAYFRCERDKAIERAATLPTDKMFPIYHETFEKNAERIADGTVNLIATDPNWHLADDSEKGSMYTLDGIAIAPQLLVEDWHKFGKLAAQKMTPGGYVAVLVGQQNRFEIDTVLRQHLTWVWDMCYLHLSGSGTVARKAGFASHYRTVLVYRRKDAPKKPDMFKKFIHDVVPDIPKIVHNPETILEALKMERQLLDARIAEAEADDGDPLINDIIPSLVRRGEALKQWHPWAQSVEAWKEIIRRLSKAGDFVWEPFAGSGTTGIAAVTCIDWHLKDGKWSQVPAPRRGIGCDAMECWAKIAKDRIWSAQHPDTAMQIEDGDDTDDTEYKKCETPDSDVTD